MTTLTNTTLYFVRQPGDPAPSGRVRLMSHRPKNIGQAMWTFHIPPAAFERIVTCTPEAAQPGSDVEPQVREADWDDLMQTTWEVETA